MAWDGTSALAFSTSHSPSLSTVRAWSSHNLTAMHIPIFPKHLLKVFLFTSLNSCIMHYFFNSVTCMTFFSLNTILNQVLSSLNVLCAGSYIVEYEIPDLWVKRPCSHWQALINNHSLFTPTTLKLLLRGKQYLFPRQGAQSSLSPHSPPTANHAAEPSPFQLHAGKVLLIYKENNGD